MRECALLVALCALGACSDDSTTDGGAFDAHVADLPASLPDLSTCTQPTFDGFPGLSDAERRLSCPCGCTIDSLEMAATSGLWNKSVLSSTLSDSTAGVVAQVDGAQGPAFATLSSINPLGPFYLDGDFDLRVDYLASMLAESGAMELRVTATDGTFFVVQRDEHGYSAQLGGLATTTTTTATTGTLRLTRTGFTIIAYGDGTQIGKDVGGAGGRVTITVGAGITACASDDGGAPDGGGACALTATFHDLRLATGALVDRP